MKWVTPLWSDPVGWSDWIAKTKLRVCIWTLIHMTFVSLGCLMIEKYGVLAGAPIIVFIGVAYPSMYMCAMHQLLKMAKNETASSSRYVRNE